MEKIDMRDLKLTALDTLPKDCISKIISHTTPRDACVIASVSKILQSAAQSNLVWETFLPSGYSFIVPCSINCLSKKEIYIFLADESVLIDDGKKSLWLDKSSGSKCYMISSMDLTFSELTYPVREDCLEYMSFPESKFEKIAYFDMMWGFDIRGQMSCKVLSKRTYYSVYFVFKIRFSGMYFLENSSEAEVGLVGEEPTRTFVCIGEDCYRDKQIKMWKGTKKRVDGWSEVEIGKFYNNGDCSQDKIQFAINQVCAARLIFQGIEIRPSKQE